MAQFNVHREAGGPRQFLTSATLSASLYSIPQVKKGILFPSCHRGDKSSQLSSSASCQKGPLEHILFLLSPRMTIPPITSL